MKLCGKMLLWTYRRRGKAINSLLGSYSEPNRSLEQGSFIYLFLFFFYFCHLRGYLGSAERCFKIYEGLRCESSQRSLQREICYGRATRCEQHGHDYTWHGLLWRNKNSCNVTKLGAKIRF
jgi:hypothetical protein